MVILVLASDVAKALLQGVFHQIEDKEEHVFKAALLQQKLPTKGNSSFFSHSCFVFAKTVERFPVVFVLFYLENMFHFQFSPSYDVSSVQSFCSKTVEACPMSSQHLKTLVAVFGLK